MYGRENDFKINCIDECHGYVLLSSHFAGLLVKLFENANWFTECRIRIYALTLDPNL